MGKKLKETDEKQRQKEEAKKKKKRDEVATFLRHKISTKSAIIKREKVEYFTGSKAVDCLMESRWAKNPDIDEEYSPCIRSRKDAVLFCEILLKDRYFVRAEKVELKFKEDPQKKEEAKNETKRDQTIKKRDAKPKDQAPDSPTSSEKETKKKKRFRLREHPSQHFLDSDDVYIWHYEPVGKSSYALGLAVVVGTVAFTLRPLWPESSNILVWYFSMFLLVLVAALIALYVVRFFAYGLVLIFTSGRVKFWILPNLDNDKLGFFASFKPLYSLEKKPSKNQESDQESDGEERPPSTDQVEGPDNHGEERPPSTDQVEGPDNQESSTEHDDKQQEATEITCKNEPT